MLTIIYSTHKDLKYNSDFKQHLIKTIGIKDFEILEFQNNNEFSLSEIYNKGIKQSKFDIVVCLHNDIKLESGWGKKLIKDFEENPEFGIIGKAGSCYFPESGIYWEKMHETMVGQVYHQPSGQKKWLNKYSPKINELIPVVTIDGLFISFNKTKIKHLFDETIGKFHFYDHLFCVPNFLDGIKLGVTSSFEIIHESVGQPNEEFFESKIKFLEKYGSRLPLDLKPSKVYVEQFKEKPIKNIGKVAIIIPTKGNVEILKNCILSFIEHCNTSLFEIFIADTGSSSDDLLLIKDFILSNKDKCKLHLIEYNYYNFAKINNDVVKNHISDEFEFLLFSNNDIKILNNVVYGMLSIFKEKNNVGTVGARLHFENNTVQHGGMVLFFDKQKKLQISHLGLRKYYFETQPITEIIGNTGALIMIRKKTFEKCGMFNENYISCFEDVELNLQCINLGYKNYISYKCVAYHYESLTRNEDPENILKLSHDYKINLLPYVISNNDKIKNYIQRL
jgi:GT2 family glycosyltransferase